MVNIKLVLAFACIVSITQAGFWLEDGDRVSIPPGMSINLRFESFSDAGYEWSHLELPEETFFTLEYKGIVLPKNALPGDSGFEYFRLTASEDCQPFEGQKVTFVNAQPWDPSSAESRTVTLFCQPPYSLLKELDD